MMAVNDREKKWFNLRWQQFARRFSMLFPNFASARSCRLTVRAGIAGIAVMFAATALSSVPAFADAGTPVLAQGGGGQGGDGSGDQDRDQDRDRDQDHDLDQDRDRDRDTDQDRDRDRDTDQDRDRDRILDGDQEWGDQERERARELLRSNDCAEVKRTVERIVEATRRCLDGSAPQSSSCQAQVRLREEARERQRAVCGG